MTITDFIASLAESSPPDGLSAALRALWLERKGEWDRAHETVQDEAGAEAAWVHAYLHRREGDSSNASYWYSRAGRTTPKATLDEEWRAITEALLARSA